MTRIAIKGAEHIMGATVEVPTKFRDLLIGDFFDFMSPDRMMNSFYDRCEKISARKYRSQSSGYEIRVGSIDAKVYHVNGASQ